MSVTLEKSPEARARQAAFRVTIAINKYGVAEYNRRANVSLFYAFAADDFGTFGVFSPLEFSTWFACSDYEDMNIRKAFLVFTNNGFF